MESVPTSRWGEEGVALLSMAKLGHLLCCIWVFLSGLQQSQRLSWHTCTHCETGLPCLKLEVGLFCMWPPRAASGPAKQVHSHLWGKGKGVSTPPCYKGQTPLLVRQRTELGTQTYCCLHPILPGSSFVADSTFCTSRCCLGSPEHHDFSCQSSSPSTALAFRVTTA